MKIALTQPARSLRQRSTDAERKLWSRLRDRRLMGFKFKRQAPRGRYVVDFLCVEAALVVEVDGSQHATQTQSKPIGAAPLTWSETVSTVLALLEQRCPDESRWCSRP